MRKALPCLLPALCPAFMGVHGRKERTGKACARLPVMCARGALGLPFPCPQWATMQDFPDGKGQAMQVAFWLHSVAKGAVLARFWGKVVLLSD